LIQRETFVNFLNISLKGIALQLKSFYDLFMIFILYQ